MRVDLLHFRNPYFISILIYLRDRHRKRVSKQARDGFCLPMPSLDLLIHSSKVCNA